VECQTVEECGGVPATIAVEILSSQLPRKSQLAKETPGQGELL